MNFLLHTDSYKVTHWPQYPPGTQRVYSYLESRGGKFDQIRFFGLQEKLLRYFVGKKVGIGDLYIAEQLFKKHFGADLMNKNGWDHIIQNHDGKLPLSIRAVPEGMLVPTGNVLLTIENTCAKCWWLTNYMETLLVQLWYPITVCTLSGEIRKVILDGLEKTGDPNLIDFKLHDFGFRGVSSVESAGTGGLAHLVNFRGTDTLAALDVAQKYYACDCAGFSIPAAEHSTITSWGQTNETDAVGNMLDKYPTGLAAIVGDSYDIRHFCEVHLGTTFKEKIKTRNGTVIARPDSGDPPEIVLEVIKILGQQFGYETNAKGFKVLDPHIRVIQGDGVNLESIKEVIRVLISKGWSIDNIAFGMGGALLQQLNRDTQKFAMKCSSINVNGVERRVSKNPITDKGKASKAGRLALIMGEYGRPTTVNGPREDDLLVEVFRNGVLKKFYSLEEIRKRAGTQT